MSSPFQFALHQLCTSLCSTEIGGNLATTAQFSSSATSRSCSIGVKTHRTLSISLWSTIIAGLVLRLVCSRVNVILCEAVLLHGRFSGRRNIATSSLVFSGSESLVSGLR